jgi:hypothetical protein
MGALSSPGGMVRPIHIGSALVDPSARGPEPDCLRQHNISDKIGFADLRLHHYVSQLDLPPDHIIAIMQYRRMFFLGQPRLFAPREQFLYRKLKNTSSDKWNVSTRYRDSYLKRIARLTQEDLLKTLNGHTAILTGHARCQDGLEQDYLTGTQDLFPDDVRYVDAWYDMRRLLEKRVGTALVAEVLDGPRGYFHNAIVTSGAEFKAYADFMFDLFDDMPEYHHVPRILGYLGERLQPVYIRHRQKTAPQFRVKHQRIMFFNKP